MIPLGATEFYLAAPAMPRDEFRSYSTELFDQWDQRISSDFALRDYSLRLELEEGSIEGLAWIGAGLSALYAGIANYPSFLEGLDKIRTQVRDAGDYLANQAAQPFTRLNLKPRITRRSGIPGQLQRLFLRVKRRELEVEAAMREAEHLIGAEAASSPEFMSELAESLTHVQRAPEQLFLPMELPEEVTTISTTATSRRPRAPKDEPVPTQQLKIEVWRDSRSGKRHVRITEL
jgi:hypothetical protein